ncbi:hypothetical protein N7468_007228 [Penicillium chermesinum]|uniref:Uncharacterized protein n=1 Tax=Penicillium chermesinum TaxID=63820 RepID=A0A9W9NU21_9EURO|nr:uncharacterized protein N7468_007228 [Penicillium chermesinum]KAJ5226003.1 hypothetical protein N7468_007228 [Penicillium chermesinum]
MIAVALTKNSITLSTTQSTETLVVLNNLQRESAQKLPLPPNTLSPLKNPQLSSRLPGVKCPGQLAEFLESEVLVSSLEFLVGSVSIIRSASQMIG